MFTRQTNTIIAELVEVLGKYGKDFEVRNIAILARDVNRILDAGKLKHHIAGVSADQGKPWITLRAFNDIDVCTVRMS